MKKSLSAVVALFCFSLTLPAFAAHPLSSDDAGTNGKMKFQLETSAEFARDKQDGVTSNSQSIGVALSAGLLETLDISLAVPYTWKQEDQNRHGVEDVTVALKYRFLEIGSTSFAVKPAVTIPTGNDPDFGAGRPSYGVTLISTCEFKELKLPTALHANVGYIYQVYPDTVVESRKSLWNVSLAGAVEVAKGVQLVAEVGAATNDDKADSAWPAFITGGVIYSALESLDLSLGIKGGLNAPATDIAVLTGLTFKFP